MNSQLGIRQSSWKQWVGGLAATSIMVHPSLDISWMYGPEDEPIRATTALLTFIVVTIGAYFGAILADTFGRKPILLATLIFIIPRMVYVIYEDAPWQWIAQIFVKFGSGITCTVVPLFISEIACANNRGNLLVLPLLAYSIGVAIMTATVITVVSCELSSYVINIISGILLVISVLLQAVILALFPETPHYLNSKKRYREAAKSLAFFTGNNHIKISEDAIQLPINSHINEKRQGCSGKISELMRFENRRSLAMIFSLIVTRWVSGQFRNSWMLFNSTENVYGSENVYLTLSIYSIELIFVIFILFAIIVLQRKVSVLFVILVCFIAAIIGISDFYLGSWVIVIVSFIHRFGHLILVGVTLAYTGGFFSTNVRAIAIAVVISFEMLIRNLCLIADFHMLSSTLPYYINSGAFFIAFIFLFVFFPKTNNLKNFEIAMHVVE